MNEVFINTKAKDQHSYEAIVVGSGMSGGWAAKGALREKGLKTLVLERGRDVKACKRLSHCYATTLGAHSSEYDNRR